MTAAVFSNDLLAPNALPSRGASLRQRLREATADQHAELDAAMGRLELRERAGYLQFLQMNAAALLPLEAALTHAGASAILPDWMARKRAGAIASDINRLSGRLRTLQRPALAGEEVLGALYVLEGSRLGAKFLIRDVASSIDPAVLCATSYLRHGEGQPLWQSFLKTLERHGAALPDDTRVVAGARFAFEFFARATRPL